MPRGAGLRKARRGKRRSSAPGLVGAGGKTGKRGEGVENARWYWHLGGFLVCYRPS